MQEGFFEVCFNKHSILGLERADSLKAFVSALRGLVNVYNKMHSSCEFAHIYYDCLNPYDECIISYDYNLRDALADVESYNPDLYEFFMHLATKAPFIKHVRSDLYESLQRWGFAAGNIRGDDAKIFYFALLVNAYVFSLPCDGWDTSFVTCYGHGFSNADPVQLKNICEERPDFLPPENTCVVKRFDQGDCRIYVYFLDHPPPHAHARHNEWCAVIKLSEPFGFIGTIPDGLQGKVRKYVKNNLAGIQASWDTLNPKAHEED